MDLAFNFASPLRRNAKMELPIPPYRSKSFDNAMPIHIPMESDSSSIFEATSGSFGITRWFMDTHYDASNFNYTQKSANFGKSGTAFHKIVMPKEPSVAISISPQTIVGGFVGSKTYARRSMFSDSNQIWDVLVCKVVELLSLEKEKPPSATPKNKSQSMPSDSCNSGTVNKKSQPETSVTSACGPASVPCTSSKKSVPRISCPRVSDVPDSTNRVPDCSASTECKAVVPETEKPILNSSTGVFLLKGTYSSVVEGTFKNSAQCGSCTMVNVNQKEQPPDGPQTRLLHVPLQSYADVAKIIPNKPVLRPNKSGCEVKQNSKNPWDTRIKRNKNTQNKKVVNRQWDNNRNSVGDEFMSNGVTWWKEDWKSKREKFQRKCPVALPSNSHSSPNGESSEDSSMKESFTKESETDPVLECKRTPDEKETIQPGCLKGFRGRHPSECSLDSEDSYVIFEECLDPALDSLTCISVDHDFSLEESDSEEDDSSSSSDCSDSEDDAVDSGELRMKIGCPSSNTLMKVDCSWMNNYCAQSVPEKSKGVRKKMVHFPEGSQLAVVRPMIAWGYAYREARRGPWEVHARDRARFHCRIASLAPILNAVLDPLHRRNVVASRLLDL